MVARRVGRADFKLGHYRARPRLSVARMVMLTSVMFREIAEAAAADPALDLGVRLTLTSEWEHYRWAPISTVGRASGLIGDDGFFWRDVASLHRRMVPAAELRAQIERARSAGINPDAYRRPYGGGDAARAARLPCPARA
jgi:hypothetical protein